MRMFTTQHDRPFRLILYWNQSLPSGSSCIGKELGWPEKRSCGILVEASRGQGDPCLTGHAPRQPDRDLAHPGGQREDNAQVEDPYGRGQALQQDWNRQNQAGTDEDAAHPYFEIAKSETQAGTDPAGFRRRLQEGSAHVSLRLIAVLSPDGDGASGPQSNPLEADRAPGSPADSSGNVERFRLLKSE